MREASSRRSRTSLENSCPTRQWNKAPMMVKANYFEPTRRITTESAVTVCNPLLGAEQLLHFALSREAIALLRKYLQFSSTSLLVTGSDQTLG